MWKFYRPTATEASIRETFGQGFRFRSPTVYGYTDRSSYDHLGLLHASTLYRCRLFGMA